MTSIDSATHTLYGLIALTGSYLSAMAANILAKYQDRLNYLTSPSAVRRPHIITSTSLRSLVMSCERLAVVAVVTSMDRIIRLN